MEAAYEGEAKDSTHNMRSVWSNSKALLKSKDNDTDKKKKTHILLFQAKTKNDDSTTDQFKQKLGVFHLAQHISTESLAVDALCEKVYPVNWDLPHDLIFLPDELDKLANTFLCRKCMLKAMTLTKEWDEEE
jgi:hypothetical protein